MIRVISIGTDRKVFEKGSAVRERLLKQRELFSELHVVVFSTTSAGLVAEQIGNLWLYPTNSLSRWFYVRDAVSLARGLIGQRAMTSVNSVITVQDPFECGLTGFLVSRKTALPLHVQVHTDFLSPEFSKLSLLNRFRVRLARFILPRAKRIRVVSSRISDSIHANVAKVTAPIEVLPVISIHALLWGAKPLRRFKKEEGGSCLALMVSRFSPEKGISLALRALEQAREAGSAVAMVLAGEGPEQTRIEDEICVRGLESVVRVELWSSDTSSFYRVSDVVLATSRFEGYGLVLLEAAVHGKPIITTDVGIARELIPETYRRFICPVGDAECVAKCLSELSGDAKLRLAYGSALRASAKKFLIPEDEYWKRYRADLENCVRSK